jgi:hypothetical protein
VYLQGSTAQEEPWVRAPCASYAVPQPSIQIKIAAVQETPDGLLGALLEISGPPAHLNADSLQPADSIISAPYGPPPLRGWLVIV